MDRIETDAVADENGIVHVAAGPAGARVHVTIDAIAAQAGPSQALAAFDAIRATLTGRVWAEPADIANLIELGRYA